MAGPHLQRPQSAYYAGLNGSSNGHQSSTRRTVGGGPEGRAITTSTSYHTGLHAIRTISHDSELIYRGSNGNSHSLNNNTSAASSSSIRDTCAASTSRSIIQQQPTLLHHAPANGAGGGGGVGSSIQLATIAGPGQNPNDALIVPAATLTAASQQQHRTESANISSHSHKSSSSKCKQRSIEIIVDATKCDTKDDEDDIEQGKARRSSRHRHRPLHKRFLNYLKSLFQGSTTQTDSELEEFETPARYRPDSLSALSRSTRFTEDEIKRIYRGFKAECPTGVVKEETFKLIYSQFFPQGGSCANPTLYAHYVFNTLDRDHTGIVSFEDFVQGLSILSRGSIEEKLRWTFQLYDINGDGYITREEMTDIVTAIYELMGRLPDELPEEEKIKGKVEQIFQKMDMNRDGVVTLEEFLEACHNDDAISRSMSVFDSAF